MRITRCNHDPRLDLCFACFCLNDESESEQLPAPPETIELNLDELPYIGLVGIETLSDGRVHVY